MYVEKKNASEINEVLEAIKGLVQGEVKKSLFNIEIDKSASPELADLVINTKLLLQKYEESRKCFSDTTRKP